MLIGIVHMLSKQRKNSCISFTQKTPQNSSAVLTFILPLYPDPPPQQKFLSKNLKPNRTILCFWITLPITLPWEKHEVFICWKRKDYPCHTPKFSDKQKFINNKPVSGSTQNTQKHHITTFSNVDSSKVLLLRVIGKYLSIFFIFQGCVIYGYTVSGWLCTL